MNQNYDEPIFVDVVAHGTGAGGQQVEEEIRLLCAEQPFAVLATQGEGQPYTSLISFAASADLKAIVFSTPAQTRKYSLITRNRGVSLMIDNRSQQPESINLICGLTVTGKARILENSEEKSYWGGVLTDRHAYLKRFVASPTSSLILVETVRFFYVRRFQEVYQWIPPG